MSSVVGRDAELASIRAFIEGVSDGAAALVLEGEAGMGKTTLWRACVATAEEGGLRVLTASPGESETALSFSGIGDLLDTVLDRALTPLPAGQRRALSRALILDDDEGPSPDPHAVGIALLNAFRSLAEELPLIVAVDDVQWLDPASSGALAYAARRFREEHVGVLLARRIPLESALVVELGRSLPADRRTAIEVGPLDAPALHRMVHDQLGASLPRPLLAEVHQASGGNPFYALEIVRMLRRSHIAIEAGQPLPVPDSLHDLVHGRLQALPSECRTFLLAAAAHAHPTIALTEDASGVARDAGLVPALEAGVVELEGERIRFTHPLLAAGAYETADPRRRREVHARLAELLEDPEARAWQLAASVREPDEAAAAVLEDAAARARARGAPRPAALLLDRARELTPSDRADDANRRAIDAAYFHFESGDSPRADAQLTQLVARLPAGTWRALALVRLARVRSYENQREAAELFEQAIAEAGDEPSILAVAHEGRAVCFFRLRERLAAAAEHAHLAVQLAVDTGDEALAAEALGTQLIVETLLGAEEASETVDRALALQQAAANARVLGQPLLAASVHWWWTDSVERARDSMFEMLRRARELGDESSLPYLLVVVGQGECFLGQLDTAYEHAVEGQNLAQQSGQRTTFVYCRALEAQVEAYRGNVERAKTVGQDALRAVDETAGRPAELVARSALGHLDLALGSPEAAVGWLAPIVAHARAEGFGEPSAMWFVPEQVEALVELGRLQEARELLDWYEEHARRLERASALASCLRCRGLLAAQEGRPEEALAAYAEALERHGRIEIPLDRGRTLLALGVAQRRAKRRREARATLEEALAVFERIGAALWAERARGELRRISGRAATPGALTPAEERVAALVAEGKTNREVAAALFLSERTVEGHLSHVFGKLGVRHRAEVASALASRQTQAVAPSNPGDPPVSASPFAP